MENNIPVNLTIWFGKDQTYVGELLDKMQLEGKVLSYQKTEEFQKEQWVIKYDIQFNNSASIYLFGHRQGTYWRMHGL